MLIIKYLWGRVLLNTHDRLWYLTWVRFHFPSSYCQLSSIQALMDFHGQKVNLSFSIENILRDDFPHPRKTNVIVNVPTRTASTFDGWPKMPVYHCGYEVRFSPLLMEYPPNAPSCSSGRVGGKIHRQYGDEKRFTEDSHDRFDQTKKLAGA